MLVFFRNSPKLWMLGNKLGQKGGRWWGAEGGDGGQKGGGEGMLQSHAWRAWNATIKANSLHQKQPTRRETGHVVQSFLNNKKPTKYCSRLSFLSISSVFKSWISLYFFKLFEQLRSYNSGAWDNACGFQCYLGYACSTSLVGENRQVSQCNTRGKKNHFEITLLNEWFITPTPLNCYKRCKTLNVESRVNS